MAFTRLGTRTPTAVTRLRVYLEDDGDGGALRYSYKVTVEFDDGSQNTMMGDLAPHLTAGQLATIQTFMANLRTKAEGEILPPA